MYLEKMREFRRKLGEKLNGFKKGATGWYGLMIGGAMAVLGLVVMGLFLGVGSILLVTFQLNSGYGNTTYVNGSIGNATSGLLQVAQQLPLIGLALAFAIVLIVIMGAVVAITAGGALRGRE